MAAARELADLGVTANMVYPPVTETGWVTDQVRAAVHSSSEHVHVAHPDEVSSHRLPGLRSELPHHRQRGSPAMTGPRPKPTAHLIHGYLGVGKTSFARQLSEQTGAIRLSSDEWYLRLYTDGHPTEHLDDVLWRRLKRQLDELWPQLLARGIDVVLDFGFWSRSERENARSLAAAAGADVVLYSLVCPDSIARRRLRARSRHHVDSFVISDAAYDELRAKFEPVGADEPHTEVNNGDD